MFCSNCGRELGEEMKFCPHCGAKVAVQSVSGNSSQIQANCTKSDTSKANADSLPLYGGIIHCSSQRRVYAQLYRKFSELASDCETAFVKLFKSHQNAASIVKKIEADYFYVIQRAVNLSLSILSSVGIHTYDQERFIDAMSPYIGAFQTSFLEYVAEYQSIVDDRFVADAYISAQQLNHSRFIGGGFGLAGAVKGMALAGVANATSDLFAAMIASMQRTSSDKRYAKLFDRLTSTQKAEPLAAGTAQDIMAAIPALETIFVNEFGSKYCDPYKFSAKESDLVFKKLINNEVPESEAQSLLVKVIDGKPFDPKFFQFALSTYGDSLRQFPAIIDYFSVAFDYNAAASAIEEVNVTQQRMERVFGSEWRLIYEVFIKNSSSPYQSIILDRIGDRFLDIYDDFILRMPTKLNSAVSAYCWKDSNRFSSTVLQECHCKLRPGEYPLLLIDAHGEVLESGLLLFTNLGLYGNHLYKRNYGSVLWADCYRDYHLAFDIRDCKMPEKWWLDISYIIDFFYICFVLAGNMYESNALCITVQDNTHPKPRLSEVCSFPESEFIKWLKKSVSKKCGKIAMDAFAFSGDEKLDNASFPLCLNLSAHKIIAFYSEKIPYGYSEKGLLFTDRGIYVVHGYSNNKFIPYAKISRVSYKYSLSEVYISIESSWEYLEQVVCVDKGNAANIVGITIMQDTTCCHCGCVLNTEDPLKRNDK